MKKPVKAKPVEESPKTAYGYVVETKIAVEPEIDHAAEITALVSDLKSTSPSGVETIAAKIMEHVHAWRDQ